MTALLPQLALLVIDDLAADAGIVHIRGHVRSADSRCGRCGRESSRVHSRYQRTVADTVLGGRPVAIQLGVRRFFCDNPACAAQTFAEQIPDLTTRYARRTALLTGVLVSIALALAGRAGARLAGALGMATSRSTLLRLLRALPDPPVGQVAVLGVDDFALRRGQIYGTVLVDLDDGHNRPVDIFDGREADDFADWLRAHPGVQVICRDRAGAYAAGARDGAPDAVQVADRWHLWHNLCEHMRDLVAAHHACLPEPAVAAGGHAAATDAACAGDDLADVCAAVDLSVLEAPDTALAERTRARYEQIGQLHDQGVGIRTIARRLGLDRKTVRRFTAAGGPEQLVAAGRRSGLLDEFKPYLHQRLAAGMRIVSVLHAEILARGYTGSYQTLSRYVRPLRRVDAAALAALPKRPPPVTVRQVTGWLTSDPEHVDADDAARAAAIRARCPELDAAARHVDGFAKMITNLDGSKLPDWMDAVDEDDLPPLHSFTTGLRADIDAVTAGLTSHYSSGPVEGNVNRIKMIKRQMYGRANTDLLRKRVLLA